MLECIISRQPRQTNSEGGNLPVVTLECATCIVTRDDPKEGTRGEYGVR